MAKAASKFLWNENGLKPFSKTLGELRKMKPKRPTKDTALDDDVRPRSLYMRRDVLNGDEIRAWAKSQGFKVAMPAEQMHVTIVYSKTPIDWLKMGTQSWDENSKGHLVLNPGGPRVVERFGDAIVLAFASSTLAYRHMLAIEVGASYDFDEYTPHITFTYTMPRGLDLEKVVPYRGKIELGPEIFEEIKGSFDPKTIIEDKKPKEQRL